MKEQDYMCANCGHKFSAKTLVCCPKCNMTESQIERKLNSQEQKRGQLTDRIKERSKELLGYEIGVRELRLMPYIVYTMMNSQKIDPKHINGEERDILQKWREAGHIEGGASGLRITEEFWNILCEIIRLGYVDID